MFDASLAREVNVQLGPVSLRVGRRRRRGAGLGLLVAGVLLLALPYTPLGLTLPAALRDTSATLGLLLLLAGGLLYGA